MVTSLNKKNRDIPVNTRRSPNVAVMLGQRRRRWPNITATFGECLVITGLQPMKRRAVVRWFQLHRSRGLKFRARLEEVSDMGRLPAGGWRNVGVYSVDPIN